MASGLESARYVSLATFRRDGREVRTPVWFAPADGRYVVFSAADAGKVKRLRAGSAARVAPCDVRGRLRGDWREADARLLSDERDRRRALQALRRKYGWQMRLADLLARLSGRFDRRAYIEVDVHEATA